MFSVIIHRKTQALPLAALPLWPYQFKILGPSHAQLTGNCGSFKKFLGWHPLCLFRVIICNVQRVQEEREGNEPLPSGLSHVSGKIPEETGKITEETASGMRAEFWYMLSTCHDGEGVALGTESILRSAARTQFRPCKLLKLMLGNNRV